MHHVKVRVLKTLSIHCITLLLSDIIVEFLNWINLIVCLCLLLDGYSFPCQTKPRNPVLSAVTLNNACLFKKPESTLMSQGNPLCHREKDKIMETDGGFLSHPRFGHHHTFIIIFQLASIPSRAYS